MGDPPEISVLLPVWNAAGTVERAVESCLAQTFADFELIIVDDGCTDGSNAILEDLAGGDRKIRLIRQAVRTGVVGASNRALGDARGSLVARMDADDVCHPEKLARQRALMCSQPGIGVCGCGVRIVPADPDGGIGDGFANYAKWLNGLTEPGTIAAERFIESPLANPTAMMRRDVVGSAGGWRETEWAEDYDLFLRLLDGGVRFAKVPDILLDWTDGPGRLTRTDPRYSQTLFLKAKAHYLAKLPDVRMGGVRICGAGPIGKRIARFLSAEGVPVRAFYDVHPRRIGECIAGAPVLGQDELVRDAAVLLGAVGLPGVRQKIRAIARDLDFTEGVDFFCVA